MHYPVNEELKLFLERFKGMSAKSEYSWLLPCYYVEPEGGLQLNGSGTETDPYILHTGTNSVTSTGETYLSFTCDLEGAYTLKIDNTEIALELLDGSAQTSLVTSHDYVSAGKYKDYKKLTVFYAYENGTKIYKITSEGSYTIEIARNDSSRDLAATEADDSTSGRGTNSSNAIAVTGSGSAYVEVDTSIADGVYISFRVSTDIAEGKYTFDVGSYTEDGYQGGYILYNGGIYYGNQLTLDAKYEMDDVDHTMITYTMLLVYRDAYGNLDDGSFMLNIYRNWTSDNLTFVDGNTPAPNKTFAQLGENTVNLSAEQSNGGISYSFTAMETSYYKLSIISGSNAFIGISDNDFTELQYDGTEDVEYVFALKTGETLEFDCYGDDASAAANYVFKIEKTVTPPAEYTTDKPYYDVEITSLGYEANLTVATDGK
jgi:hypothetical protein